MKTTFAVLALAAAAYAAPQGVSATIAPSAPAPAGCTPSYSGTFNIANINATTSSKHKRELAERQLSGTLTLTLTNGVLKDQAGRTGYIAANRQFQFDNPPQTGAIYTSGFSACSNSTLALGGSTIFYQCYSGGFYNLYDQSTGNQCSRIYFQILPVASGSATATSAAATSAGATVRTDGQPIVSTARSSVVSQITDGQPQASSARSSVISQISDGQPQASSARSSAISTAPRVSQISDGQPQATTAARISQISDGQPQATTAARISQISDGQPQATTAARISQISDGQPQASSAARTTGAVISQISDGQPQATRAANSTTARISQISDGQPQATRAGNGTTATPTRAAATSTAPAQFTGAAQPVAVANFFAIAAGAAAVALL